MTAGYAIERMVGCHQVKVITPAAIFVGMMSE